MPLSTVGYPYLVYCTASGYCRYSLSEYIRSYNSGYSKQFLDSIGSANLVKHSFLIKTYCTFTYITVFWYQYSLYLCNITQYLQYCIVSCTVVWYIFNIFNILTLSPAGKGWYSTAISMIYILYQTQFVITVLASFASFDK